MLGFIQHMFVRILYTPSRADALKALRRRLAEQDGPKQASPEEMQAARALRGLRETLLARLGRVDACAQCVRPQSPDWPGGHCCSGRTEDLFTEDELAALKLSGTTGRHLRPPHRTSHVGCAFRGPRGCSLPPSHRPSLCVRYTCFDLQREIDRRPDADEINRLQAEIQHMAELFVHQRNARRDAHMLESLKHALGECMKCKNHDLPGTRRREAQILNRQAPRR